jgi:putative hemolysin
VLAALLFITVRACREALPLLRRTVVRETLKDGSLSDAVVRRLRSSRVEYEQTIDVLSLMAIAGASAMTLSMLIRETTFAWPMKIIVLLVVASAIFAVGTLSERLPGRLGINRLVAFGTATQLLLWPLLPLHRILRLGLGSLDNRSDSVAPINGDAPLERSESDTDIEDELADEPPDRQERAMIRAIMHMDQTPVREIMVPRVDVVAIDVSTSPEQAVSRVLESGHSRLPVYEDSPDNVMGILYSRDLLAASIRGESSPLTDLRQMIRPCFFVPESKRVDEMLSEFQQRRVHLAVVVDEYGGIAGIVTIEDLLEEIVGEIEDEFDREEPAVERTVSGEAIVDARMSMDRFNEEFGVDLLGEGFDTVGGLLFSRMGRIPTAGDVVRERGLQIQVTVTAGRRVKKLRVTRIEEEAPTTSSQEHSERVR